MLDEGNPKEMVDMYKQLLVNQEPVKQGEEEARFFPEKKRKTGEQDLR